MITKHQFALHSPADGTSSALADMFKLSMKLCSPSGSPGSLRMGIDCGKKEPPKADRSDCGPAVAAPAAKTAPAASSSRRLSCRSAASAADGAALHTPARVCGCAPAETAESRGLGDFQGPTAADNSF